MTHPYLTLLLGYCILAYLIALLPLFAFISAALFGNLQGRTTPKFWLWVIYFGLCAPFTVPKWLWDTRNGQPYVLMLLKKSEEQ